MNSPFRMLSTLASATMLALAGHSALAAEGAKPSPGAAAAAHAPAPAPILAVVSGKTILAEEFEAAANESARQKFYHGAPPEGALDQLLRDVANRMIDRVLLLDEAARRKMTPDAAAVQARIDDYDKRYGNAPRWRQERETILPSLRERLDQDNILERLEAEVRRIPAPAEDKVRAYYKANPDKFTEPEKMRLSLILLTVDPSSPTAAWEAAEREAAGYVKRLREGASFAELARTHSAHESATRGGDLGYVHRGMLPDGIQDKIDSMKPGDLSEPTRVLQGYAVFRYDALQPAKHHDFATVRQRASDLLARDLAEKAWTDFRADLRKKAKVDVNTQRYPALAQPATAGGR